MDKNYYNRKGKITGRLSGETYYTDRNKNHFFIKFQGFGISLSILTDLKEKGCKNIQITYFGKTKIKYYCSLDSFSSSSKKWNDEGEDLQLFVSTRDMKEI